MKRRSRILIPGIVVCLGGCTLAPHYSRPTAPVPAEWPTGAAYQDTRTAANAPQAPGLKWWEFFPDERLQAIIVAALANNRDLRLAALNVERAQAFYGIQRAELLPAVNAVGNASKSRDLFPAAAGKVVMSEQYSVSLGASAWEIDFFGRLRSLKDEALQQYLATEQARRSAQILLVSEVANAYFIRAADRESLATAESTLVSQKIACDLIKQRCDLGLAPELDLHRAQSQVDAARGDVAHYTQLVAQDGNALDLLVGAPVAAERLPAQLANVAPPAEISAGLPSDVLLRRPDVLQAEGLLRAAYADIGAARATFFPRISLTAAVGTASDELSGLFKTGSGTWSFAPQIAMPVFDARTWSAYKVSKVERDIAVTQYERVIQGAFREVADALAVRGTVDEQLSAQQSLVHAASETYRLSTSRYDKGIDMYLSVLDAQRSLYAAQQGLISVRLSRLANMVRLYAVLGGGA